MSQASINRQQYSETQEIARTAIESQSIIGGLADVLQSPQARRLMEQLSEMATSSDPSSPPTNRRLFNPAAPPSAPLAPSSLPLAPVFRETPDYSLDSNLPSTCPLDRSLSTVVDAWKEYDEGMAGKPPLRRMEEVFKGKWRGIGKDRQWWSSRQPLYKEIMRRAETEGKTPLEVAGDMDYACSHSPDGTSRRSELSLASVQQSLKPVNRAAARV